MNLLVKNSKFPAIFLTVIALIGIMLPLVNIAIHFLGTVNISFSLIDLFSNLGELPQDTLDLPMGDAGLDDLGLYVAIPFLAYILAILLMIVALPFTFTSKLNGLKATFVSIATGLMIFAGLRIIALPEILSEHLADVLVDMLGDFASLIDLSSVLEISLGMGYWLTLICQILLIILFIGVLILNVAFGKKH